MEVKSEFEKIMSFLVKNSGENVKTVLPGVIEIFFPDNRGRKNPNKSFLCDIQGNVIAIRDSYFKRWMPLVGEQAVEFASNATSTTGLHYMCREGTSHWSRQQCRSKKTYTKFIDGLVGGTITIYDIADNLAEIDLIRTDIAETELGFKNREDVIYYLEMEGVELGYIEEEEFYYE